MTGYYNRPDLTAQAIDRDGWLHTGDLGFLDSGGYLHYVGRIKEIINRGGEKSPCGGRSGPVALSRRKGV